MSIISEHRAILEDLPLRPDDAWYVLLVYLGLKSGAWVHLKSQIWRDEQTPYRVSEAILESLKVSLNALGLNYKITVRVTDAGILQDDTSSSTRFNEIADIYIAKETSVLNNIVRARETNDDTLLGISLGYPQSAVEAFSTKNRITVSDLDPKIQLSEVGQLTYFALSKDNWKNELQTVEAWIAALKSNSEIMWYQLSNFGISVDQELIKLILESRR